MKNKGVTPDMVSKQEPTAENLSPTILLVFQADKQSGEEFNKFYTNLGAQADTIIKKYRYNQDRQIELAKVCGGYGRDSLYGKKSEGLGYEFYFEEGSFERTNLHYHENKEKINAPILNGPAVNNIDFGVD